MAEATPSQQPHSSESGMAGSAGLHKPLHDGSYRVTEEAVGVEGKFSRTALSLTCSSERLSQ